MEPISCDKGCKFSHHKVKYNSNPNMTTQCHDSIQMCFLRRMVNQEWVLIAADTVCFFFSLIAHLPNKICLVMTKHILELPDTNFLSYYTHFGHASNSVNYTPKAYITVPKIFVWASSIFYLFLKKMDWAKGRPKKKKKKKKQMILLQ